jgi:outer membrane lipoprotein carrier protein
VLLAVCGAASPAEPTEAELWLERLQSWLDATRDLEARFEQALVSGALGSGLVESGRLYLKRPGTMRWDYADPEVKTALFDGTRLQLYLAEDRQLIRSTIARGEGDLLPLLLAGDERLARLFRPVMEPPSERLRRIRLEPRERAESFEHVVVSLRPHDAAITAAVVQDVAGNRMEYRFTILRRNRGLPARIFTLDLPAGTDVIDQP